MFQIITLIENVFINQDIKVVQVPQREYYYYVILSLEPCANEKYANHFDMKVKKTNTKCFLDRKCIMVLEEVMIIGTLMPRF